MDDNDEEEEDSEDLESEDEDGEELTPALDAAILRTLARIKRKDPSIYEDGKDVFQGAPGVVESSHSLTQFQRKSRRPEKLKSLDIRPRTRCVPYW